jgi:hypothetical protein
MAPPRLAWHRSGPDELSVKAASVGEMLGRRGHRQAVEPGVAGVPGSAEPPHDGHHLLAALGRVLGHVTPAADRASILAWAVPWEPEMMAPACPILRPGGAVTPAT